MRGLVTPTVLACKMGCTAWRSEDGTGDHDISSFSNSWPVCLSARTWRIIISSLFGILYMRAREGGRERGLGIPIKYIHNK
jgi:hypothetical protein